MFSHNDYTDTNRRKKEVYIPSLRKATAGALRQDLVSHTAVGNWIEEFGEKLTDEQKEDVDDIDIMELDEVHTYLGLKKTISGSGLQSTGKQENGQTLYQEIEVHQQAQDCGIN